MIYSKSLITITIPDGAKVIDELDCDELLEIIDQKIERYVGQRIKSSKLFPEGTMVKVEYDG